MLLPPFEYSEPVSLEALHKALLEGRPRVWILAGGTDLLPDLKRENDRRLRFPGLPSFRAGAFPDRVVSLSRIATLKGMLFPKRGAARIGALTTMAELAAAPKVQRMFPALAQAAGAVGTPQVRNRATVGGNFCNARPCADTAAAGVALGASVELESSRGTRRMLEAGEFFLGPGKTALEPNEVLVAVHLPLPKGGTGSAFLKLGSRKASELSLVSVAAFLALQDGRIAQARIALGSAAPVPRLAEQAGLQLAGKEPVEAAFRTAASAAASEAAPIDDFRASASYRRRMVEVLALRALTEAARIAGEGA